MQIILKVNFFPSAETIGKSCTTALLPATRLLSPERWGGFIFTICFNIYTLYLGGLASLIKYRYKSSEGSALSWLGEQPHSASAGIRCRKFVFQRSLEPLHGGVMCELMNRGLWWS